MGFETGFQATSLLMPRCTFEKVRRIRIFFSSKEDALGRSNFTLLPSRMVRRLASGELERRAMNGIYVRQLLSSHLGSGPIISA